MPVFLARLEPDDVTGADLHDRSALPLDAAILTTSHRQLRGTLVCLLPLRTPKQMFRFREEFRTLASVRKSPKNEPAVQGMSYGDLRFEAASGGGVLPASSVVKAGL
jgi:hypothetical protein